MYLSKGDAFKLQNILELVEDGVELLVDGARDPEATQTLVDVIRARQLIDEAVVSEEMKELLDENDEAWVKIRELKDRVAELEAEVGTLKAKSSTSEAPLEHVDLAEEEEKWPSWLSLKEGETVVDGYGTRGKVTGWRTTFGGSVLYEYTTPTGHSYEETGLRLKPVSEDEPEENKYKVGDKVYSPMAFADYGKVVEVSRDGQYLVQWETWGNQWTTEEELEPAEVESIFD